jgi:hypothetical protein
MRKYYGVLLTCLSLLSSAIPTLAHHAFEAEFSDKKPISITGVITKLEWSNPHFYLYLDTKDANGNVVNFEFESVPPGMARRGGLERDMLPVGAAVTVTGYGAKDGTRNLGWIKTVHFSDGRIIQVTKDNPNETTKN